MSEGRTSRGCLDPGSAAFKPIRRRHAYQFRDRINLTTSRWLSLTHGSACVHVKTVLDGRAFNSVVQIIVVFLLTARGQKIPFLEGFVFTVSKFTLHLSLYVTSRFMQRPEESQCRIKVK